MLARHAESLFWAGRYIERAESTARLLDVTYHTHLEAMSVSDKNAWSDLLKILNVDMAFSESERALQAEAVSEFLVFDPGNPGTIRSNVTNARENLRAVRELVSTELWEAINAFHLRLSARDLRDDVSGEPHGLYAMVRTHCQALAGVANETMSRDQAWNFLSLGWMLERSIMTLRLLLVRYSQLVTAGAGGGFHHWVSTLKSASGSEAFRRRYRASMDPADVVAFLLMSPYFPRSVLFGLQAADKSLAWIEGSTTPTSRPQRLLGRLRADVEYLDVDEVLAGDLSIYLNKTEHDIRQVADSVEVTYFRGTDEFSMKSLDPMIVRADVRFDIRYRLAFEYENVVRHSQNELRACPLTDEHQMLLSYRVSSSSTTRVHAFTDYWGTRVDAYGIREPHVAFEIDAESAVETRQRPLMVASPQLDALADPAFADEHAEFLAPSAHTVLGPRVDACAREVRERGEADVVSLVLDVHRRVHRSLDYTAGSTAIGISPDEILAGGVGVCQDYAHLAVALCRSLRIPARYVSGYFFAADDATGEVATGDTADVQTHAWFEAAVPGAGWFALDPTNALAVGERHVVIGRGRDYDDVPPIRGVYAGDASAEFETGVEMRLLSTESAHVGDQPLLLHQQAVQQQQ